MYLTAVERSGFEPISGKLSPAPAPAADPAEAKSASSAPSRAAAENLAKDVATPVARGGNSFMERLAFIDGLELQAARYRYDETQTHVAPARKPEKFPFTWRNHDNNSIPTCRVVRGQATPMARGSAAIMISDDEDEDAVRPRRKRARR